MQTKKKVKKKKKEDRIVAYQCYACHKYDGSFGPESKQHEHVCDNCSEITGETGPIERHYDQLMKVETELKEVLKEEARDASIAQIRRRRR